MKYMTCFSSSFSLLLWQILKLNLILLWVAGFWQIPVPYKMQSGTSFLAMLSGLVGRRGNAYRQNSEWNLYMTSVLCICLCWLIWWT